MSTGLSSVSLQPTPKPPQTTAGAIAASGPESSAATVPSRPVDRITNTTSQFASSSGDAFQSLDAATAATDAASAAGSVILDALAQVRRAVVVATEPSVNAQQRVALAAGVQTQISAVTSAIDQAGFGGVNLLDGSSLKGSTGPVAPTAPQTLQGSDLTPGGAVVTVGAQADLSTPDSAHAVLLQVDSSTAAVRTVLRGIEAQGASLASHADALARFSGAGDASDPTSSDAAGLLALQVRQQIGASGGSLVGNASQSILSLFKARAA